MLLHNGDKVRYVGQGEEGVPYEVRNTEGTIESYHGFSDGQDCYEVRFMEENRRPTVWYMYGSNLQLLNYPESEDD